MNAVTVRQVPIRLALNIKPVWIAELCRVTVGRGRPGQHDLISRNVLPSQCDIASGLMEEKPDRRQLAQRLFYRLWHQGGLALEVLHRMWVIRKAHRRKHARPGSDTETVALRSERGDGKRAIFARAPTPHFLEAGPSLMKQVYHPCSYRQAHSRLTHSGLLDKIVYH